MDVYIRVSQLGDRDEEESTEVYEAQCREWADRHGIEIGEVVEDTDVSGSVAVSERGLEHLIGRVEAGESDGIVTPYLDRFGRDLIEGAVALKKISEAGGKLVAVRDGFDSTSPGSELVFNLRMAIAQDYLRRVKENFQANTKRAVERGVWIPPRAPFGYMRDDERRLVVVEAEAEVVRELFRRRSEGVNIMRLVAWLNDEHGDLVRANRERNRRNEKKRQHRETISRSGVRSMLANRAYVGEMRVASDGKGEPLVVKNACPPILSDEVWEAAQIKHAFSRRTGKASTARLRGLVRCGTCGKRMKVGAYGPPGERKSTYSCTSDGCAKHASMTAKRLDGHVEGLIQDAVLAGEPHLVAVIEGDTSFEDAMQAVQEAKKTLDDFRDDSETQRLLGMTDFAKGIAVRKEALKVARDRLSEVRRPDRQLPGPGVFGPDSTQEERAAFVEDALRAEANNRYIDRVVVKPTGKGKRPPPADRAEVYFVGAEKPYG